MPDLVDYARSRAILIGTATYQDTRFLPLPAAANSLAGLRQVLADPRLCGWPTGRITVVEDPADMPRLVMNLRQLAHGTEEVLLLYFVGHGVILPRGRLGLVLADTDADHPDITSLGYQWIRGAFLDSPARLKIAVLDCCYSGRAIEALSMEIADETDTHGVYTLTASDHAAHVVPLSEQAEATTSFTRELLDLIRTGIPGGPERLTLGMLYPHLRRRLHLRGLPPPNQRGTDTADRFPFTRNAADVSIGPGRPGVLPASGTADPRASHGPVRSGPSNGARLATGRSGHLVIWGDNALVFRTTEELTVRYGEDVTVIVPSMAGGHQAQLTRLPRVRVIGSSDLSVEAFHDAKISAARALALLQQDDLGNFHAALRAQELNPALRLVLDISNTRLGERVQSLLPDSSVLAGASLAAPSFVAAALGEPAPSYVRLAGRTLYVARRSNVRSGYLVCGLADTRAPGPPRILPDDQESADLVLAVADGSPQDPLRRRGSRIPGLKGAAQAILGREQNVVSTGRPGVVSVSRDFGLARMSDHVIVVGLGNVGTRVASQLHDLGHRVVGIDVSEDAPGVSMAQRLEIPVVIGPDHRSTLQAARIGHCRALVCVTGSDTINLEAALNARALIEDLRIVVRMLDDDLADRAERTIGGFIALRGTSDLAAPSFAAAMLGHQLLRTISVGRHVLLIADVPVDPGAELAGYPVGEVNGVGQVRVIALRRDTVGNLDWVPHQGYRLAARDHLIVLATPAGLSQVLARSMPTPAR
jgi:Trk K+ transport system NAD-binding subunit